MREAINEEHPGNQRSRKCTILKVGFKPNEHPQYSPDLAPSDYQLFTKLTLTLIRNKFSLNNDVLYDLINGLWRWNIFFKRLNFNGDNVVKCWQNWWSKGGNPRLFATHAIFLHFL